MTEPLSQEDINQALATIKAGNIDIGKLGDFKDFHPSADKRRIKIYDFKRPDKFSKEQIRNISIIYDTFSRLTTNYLSAQCQCDVSIHVDSVDQLTYGEFIRSINAPTTLGVINPDPLIVDWLLEIEPIIAFAILHTLLGGSPEIKYQHELTDIESSIMEGVIFRMSGNLREAWTNVFELRPRLKQIDTNPHIAQIVPKTMMVALVTLEAKVGEVKGSIYMCMPYISLEPIMGKLSPQFWDTNEYNNKKDSTGLDFLKEIQVPLRAELFRKSVTLDFLSSLKPQDVVFALERQSAYTGNLLSGDIVVGKFTYSPSMKQEEKLLIRIQEKLYRKEPFMETKPNVKVTGTTLGDIKIQLIVELGRAVKTLENVQSLSEGTIVELDKLAGEPVDIFANNVKVAKGEVIVIDENFGVRVVEVLAKQENCQAKRCNDSTETSTDS